ncbi:hypothetical protein B0H14DRAFT_3513640 [Mycena olivaceomarginata]|nr:hypothetical protein B0H14DRAFT_3513640 [Mycena olivaceomarginata]
MSDKSTSSGSNSADSVTALDGLYYGAMVQMLLFGVTILQTWIYINSSRKDRRLLRIFIGFLIGMDLTHTVAVMQLVHSYVITDNFIDAKLTAEISAYTILEGVLMLFTTFAVQIFFASRVYILERTPKVVPWIIILTSIGSFVAGILSAVFQTASFGTGTFKAAFVSSAALSAVSDGCATLALLWSFRNVNLNISANTTVILQRLFQFSITRGALVALVQVFIVIFTVVADEKLIWYGLFFILLVANYTSSLLSPFSTPRPQSSDLQSEARQKQSSLHFANAARIQMSDFELAAIGQYRWILLIWTGSVLELHGPSAGPADVLPVLSDHARLMSAITF